MVGMKPYNNFPGDLRAAAQRWLNAEIAAGGLARPVACCACGQDKGVVDMHAEDYSKPFARGKTDEFHLCFSCHMAVHCRFKRAAAWDAYRALVRGGGRFQPLKGRDFPAFIKLFCAWAVWPTSKRIFHGTKPKERPLDVIDGWLKARTGKGWR